MTHFLNSTEHKFEYQPVEIKNNVFIGCNTIICKSIVVGENSVIGAGSVVTRDIPANEVWAGNPAKFLKLK